jgi:hypothetical protein
MQAGEWLVWHRTAGLFITGICIGYVAGHLALGTKIPLVAFLINVTITASLLQILADWRATSSFYSFELLYTVVINFGAGVCALATNHLVVGIAQVTRKSRDEAETVLA